MNGWQFNYAQDGYRMQVVIDRIWLDQYAIPRCAGRVIVSQICPCLPWPQEAIRCYTVSGHHRPTSPYPRKSSFRSGYRY